MNCMYCAEKCRKKGYQSNGLQKFQCKGCGKYQQEAYSYKAYDKTLDSTLTKMVKRAGGIRDISYVLEISHTTVIDRIKKIASKISKPLFTENGQSYEADELSTKLVQKGKAKDIYVSCIINHHTGDVIDFTIGGRDKETLGKIIQPVLKLSPHRIYTDGLPTYSSLIPKEIHKLTKYLINKIERFHLTLRTRIKRLARNFMCHTRSIAVLEACLKIYFWG